MSSSPASPGAEATLNIPSLLAFVAITFFAIRYFFFTPSSPSSGSSSGYPGGSNTRRVPWERIETVTQMFPQLDRRDVEWDLRRNGGSVQATTERVLREGRLDRAPPNFQAQTPPASALQNQPTPQSAEQQKQKHADLITRYNLSSRIATQASTAEEDTLQTKDKQQAKGGWSSNKDERAALLLKRRDEMVLAARRKMEARDRENKSS